MIAVGRALERAATLCDEHAARNIVRALGVSIDCGVATRVSPAIIVEMRERVSRRTPSVFLDYARDGASAFGDADAAQATHASMSALIEAIKIVDDIQDEEPECLATDVGVDAALQIAYSALAWSLERTVALSLCDDAWRAAANAIGRGLRETAEGQALEATSRDIADFWFLVDRKTPPLVATALELGALVAGADPHRAATLSRLAIPLGRILQIGDDCHDALGPDASDWRNPSLNLLMRFTLSGDNGPQLAELLRDGANSASLHAAQGLLLRDGALAYALHAYSATVRELAAIVDELQLPNPAALHAAIAKHRESTRSLLRRSGVADELASQFAS